MPGNDRKEDLRKTKTEKALGIAMFSLLGNRNFGKVTVRDICEEALISRATFYAHFADKYDLLKEWMVNFKPENVSRNDTYERVEKAVNQFVFSNEIVIKNIVSDADNETLGILHDSIFSIFNFTIEKTNPKHVVLFNFYSGGMVNYLSWHVKNNFRSGVMPMNIYLYEVIEKFQEWNFE